MYLSNKHDNLLASVLEAGTYKKRFSLVIVDGFAVEITDEQVVYTTDIFLLYLLYIYMILINLQQTHLATLHLSSSRFD